MGLEHLMATGLPLNRKERFFTGTVFPMIVCRDDFRHFVTFTSLIPGYEELTVDPRPGTANIQFFTEYSLVESIYGPSTRRFPDPPQTKDTPDIMILLEADKKVIIALEAKMYDVPTAEELKEQIRRQKVILDYVQETLGVDRVYQCALLPEQLKAVVGEVGCPVITWQDLYSRYHKAFGGEDYFLALLRLALASYDALVSRGAPYRQYCDAVLTGREIYEGFKRGEIEYRSMGRYRGLWGDPLQEDISSRRWRGQTYEVRAGESLPNRNWFAVKDFIALVDKHGV